jgi:hypothetical protein
VPEALQDGVEEAVVLAGLVGQARHRHQRLRLRLRQRHLIVLRPAGQQPRRGLRRRHRQLALLLLLVVVVVVVVV